MAAPGGSGLGQRIWSTRCALRTTPATPARVSGQRGMASIITQLGTQDFPRMRLGISRPPGQMDPVDYVLKDFLPSETELQKIVLRTAVEASQMFITEGLTRTMNQYNGEVS